MAGFYFLTPFEVEARVLPTLKVGSSRCDVVHVTCMHACL